MPRLTAVKAGKAAAEAKKLTSTKRALRSTHAVESHVEPPPKVTRVEKVCMLIGSVRKQKQ